MYTMMDASLTRPTSSIAIKGGSQKSHAPPQFFNKRTQPRTCSTPPRAQQSSDGSAGSGFGKLVQQIRGALPIVGLLSRLTSPEGGIGNDDLAYTEYSRAVFDAAPQGFQIAVADLQNKHGKAAQRRYILLCLWMVQQGVGILPGKSIVDAARRLRVSQDLEFEMERFNGALLEETTKYKYLQRPRGQPQEQADVAVDAILRLCLGLKDGVPVEGEDAALVEEVVCGGLLGTGPQFRELVKKSIETRADRALAYVNQ